MTTIETLKANIETAKLELKIAEAAIIVADFWRRKDEFIFVGFSGEMKLFKNELFLCGELNIDASDVKHWKSIFFINNDFQNNTVNKLMKALKFIEAQTKDNFKNDLLVKNVISENVK